jgi:large subunit ribosomal protein L35
MPKIKTNRGAAKRFKKTGTGKVTYFKAFARHILTKKTRKRKRMLRQKHVTDRANVNEIKRLMPYIGKLSA